MRGMDPEDWKAEWVGLDEGRETYDPSVPYYCADDYREGVNTPFLPPPPLVRKEFELDTAPKSAYLTVTALGLTEVWINGRLVTPNPLLPGVCDFRKRVYAFTYDVTGSLREGKNAVAAVIADGWYAGYIGLNPRQWWGARPRVKMEIRMTAADGSSEVIRTDGSWKAAKGPWQYADILHGSGYDARLEEDGWNEPGFDDSTWKKVQTGAEQDVPIFPHPGVPVEEGEPIPLASCRPSEKNTWILDFGRCFSGVVRLDVTGERGASVEIEHAEELKRDGEGLYTEGNRSALSRDRYVLRGTGREVFQPAFTYHGFRYACVKITGNAAFLCAEGIPISSRIEERSVLSTEHPVLSGVLDTIRNTAQCNLVDIVTDVCARDERLGWGCEGNLFLHTASACGNMTRFTRKWLQDALDGQLENGCFWAIAPAVMMRDILPFAGDLQSDIALHCAWLLMMRADDRDSVEHAYPQLQAYLAYQEQNSDRYLKFATARDWLDLSRNGRSDTDHGYGGCDPTLIGTAWYAVNARMMTEIAAYLGREDDRKTYSRLYEEIRNAFRTFFVGRNHLLRGSTQGGYLLAAAAGLLEKEDREAARQWILQDMETYGGITWGTATTPVALHGLCVLGLEKEALAFLRRTDYPSIGYMNRCGATTVWERWDAICEGRFHPHPMNAFSHIGLATVGEWIVSRMAGIRPSAPGFRELLLEPAFDRETGGLTAEVPCLYGTVHSAWHFEDAAVVWEGCVPAGTVGKIVLRARKEQIQILKGDHLDILETDDGILEIPSVKGAFAMRVNADA